MNVGTSDSKLDEQDVLNTIKYRKIDEVIFFFAAKDVPLLDDYKPEDNKGLEDLRGYYATVAKVGINPIVLIAKCDELPGIDESFRKNPLETNPKVEEARKKVANWFGIPALNVLPSLSYTEANERNCGIDLLTYKILDKALENAVELRNKSNNTKVKGYELGKPQPRKEEDEAPGFNGSSKKTSTWQVNKNKERTSEVVESD